MPRSQGKLKILEELFTQVKQLRPADAPVIKGMMFYIDFLTVPGLCVEIFMKPCLIKGYGHRSIFF